MKRVLPYLILGVLAAFGLLYGLRPRHEQVALSSAAVLPAVVSPAAVSVAATVRSPVAVSTAALARAAPPQALVAEPSSVATSAADPLRDAPEPERPHPITAAHLRIFEENNRIAALNGAMDVEDFEALRRLNADYRRAYPEDEQLLQEGYDLIADCLERRTPSVVAAAERFWREKRSSSLRRYVRRHCLSATP